MRKILATSLMIAATNLAAAGQNTSDEWEFSATPLFLWGMSIDGSSTIGSETLPLDLDFEDDILENMEAVFTLHLEASKGKWALFSEVQYVELDPTVNISTDTPPASSKTEIDFTDTMFELGVGYALFESTRARWEVIGGARYIRQEIDVDEDLKLPVGPPLSVSESVDEDWWHPFAGGRLSYSLTDNWTFVGRGDYGYGDSDNTAVNASFTFDYKFNDWGTVFAGFKYMDIDYDNDRSGSSHYAYDAKQQGPLLGLTVNW